MENLNQIPEWAIGLSHGVLQPGCQLCTKDGRKVGNGFVMSIDDTLFGEMYTVLTDAGNSLVLTLEELDDCYYVGNYVCSLDRIHSEFDRFNYFGDIQ